MVSKLTGGDRGEGARQKHPSNMLLAVCSRLKYVL